MRSRLETRTTRCSRARRRVALASVALLLTLTACARDAEETGPAVEGPITIGTSSPVVVPAGPDARIDMQALVITDGQPMTEAIRDQLDEQGLPTTIIDLREPDRPVIDAAYLGDRIDGTTPRSRFQAVVMPNELGGGISSTELQAIHDHQRAFAIRSLGAYSAPSATIGLNQALAPTGFTGAIDGITVEVGDSARAPGAPFAYLEPSFALDDSDPAITETFATAATPADSMRMTPFITASMSGAADGAVLVGQLSDQGIEHLVVTMALNEYLSITEILGPGIVSWLTRGTHLGADINQLSVDIDDVFLADARWDPARDCTPDNDCDVESSSAPMIRMTPADVDRLLRWQDRSGIQLTMAFNGYGSEKQRDQTGSDPLADALLASKDRLRWINHTFRHPHLGCVMDLSQLPTVCERDDDGNVTSVDADTIRDEIDQNVEWAEDNDIELDRTYLVSGEHSGLRSLPELEQDNPNLAPALRRSGITRIASDASREPDPRLLSGSNTEKTSDDVITVPRHPMSIFYNVGTRDELVDEYVWTYTRVSDGGSGLCERNPETSTCLTLPIDRTTFFDVIVDQEARTVLGHVLSNDPRPHYAHQSNLAEDGVLYPVLDQVIARYDAIFTDSAPLLNPTHVEVSDLLRDRAAWRRAIDDRTVVAYLQHGEVHVERTGDGADVIVPLTSAGSATVEGEPFGLPYGASRYGWVRAASPGGDED